MGRMSLRRLRVLIIEKHPAVGRALETLVGLMPGFTVVGLADRPVRALQQAIEAAPDVAVVDADLPGMWSSALIQRLRWRLPKTRVVALGFHPDQRQAALEAGAHAYILKVAGYDALRATITGEDHRADQPSGDGDAATDREGKEQRVAP